MSNYRVESIRHAAAFNRGADDRVLGVPITGNPYTHKNMKLFLQWRVGWYHADRNFGVDVGGRWEVVRLPEVRVCHAQSG